MSTDLRTDGPRLAHRLGAALRFVDAFTGEPVRLPLRVSIPARRWDAFAAGDGSYRFLATNAAVPAGTFDVEVTSPGGEYVNWEPFTLTLPLPVVPHAPPLLPGDFLITRTLWPTPRFRVPPGETALRGRVVSPSAATVSGHRVVVFKDPGPIPAAPYTRSDAGGRFLVRLPLLKKSASGGVAVASVALDAEIRNAANVALAHTPAGPLTVPLGEASVLTFTIP